MWIEREYGKPACIKETEDGPMLSCDTGRIHFLTVIERIKLYFGWTSIDNLNIIYR